MLAIFMRTTLLATLSLVLLRLVVGGHFFLEGLGHLRDSQWSSAGFRRAAVGPLANFFREGLPQEGEWRDTLGRLDGRTPLEATQAWEESVVADWRAIIVLQNQVSKPDPARVADSEKAFESASKSLDDYLSELEEDLIDYRGQLVRLDAMRRQAGSEAIPFARDRITKKQKELDGKATAWMNDVSAISRNLKTCLNQSLSAADQKKVAATVSPNSLWQVDRFVSWSLVTIGSCLVLGFLTKFNAMGGVFFLSSIIAAQPPWVVGAQPTYDQWVELSALLVIASMPSGGWIGLDYFLLGRCCRRSGSNRSASV